MILEMSNAYQQLVTSLKVNEIRWVLFETRRLQGGNELVYDYQSQEDRESENIGFLVASFLYFTGECSFAP